MRNPFWYFAGAIVACYLYDKLLTPEQKKAWQNWVKAHHGEAGVIGAGVGLATDSPRLTLASLGLVVHDWQDRDQWFKNRNADVVL